MQSLKSYRLMFISYDNHLHSLIYISKTGGTLEALLNDQNKIITIKKGREQKETTGDERKE